MLSGEKAFQNLETQSGCGVTVLETDSLWAPHWLFYTQLLQGLLICLRKCAARLLEGHVEF